MCWRPAGTGLRTLREPTRRAGVRDERFAAGLLLAAMRSSTYRRAQAGLVDAERKHQVELARRTRLYELALREAQDGRPA